MQRNQWNKKIQHKILNYTNTLEINHRGSRGYLCKLHQGETKFANIL